MSAPRPADRSERPTSTAHAHGKVILLGEHVVVYGAPALAAGIDRGARAEATPIASHPSTLALGDRVVAADAGGDDLARAFAALLAQGASAPGGRETGRAPVLPARAPGGRETGRAPVLPARAPGGRETGRAPVLLPPLAVTAASELPPGGGLGSSAALGVAVARAVEAFVDPVGIGDSGDTEAPGRDDRVLARASAWERVFHGSPSGIDTAAAIHGGVLRFDRARGVRPVRAARELWLCVGHSGASSSTRAMVEGVARLRARRPEVIDSAVAGVASLVENAALAIEAGDLAGLGRLMDLNQMILAGLMLSTEAIEAMVSAARSFGALGAKLTGAGGGGSVIALVPSARLGASDVSDAAASAAADRILASWTQAGYGGFVTRIAGARAVENSTP